MPITRTESRVTINQAARFAVCGEGWVMPMVLMKAFEMMRRMFIFPSQEPHSGYQGTVVRGLLGGES
jgi:hypothetical protein